MVPPGAGAAGCFGATLSLIKLVYHIHCNPRHVGNLASLFLGCAKKTVK